MVEPVSFRKVKANRWFKYSKTSGGSTHSFRLDQSAAGYIHLVRLISQRQADAFRLELNGLLIRDEAFVQLKNPQGCVAWVGPW